ncbi:MAG: metal-sensing transcriptional repressor [Candidatus Harrisonbacteria bacterium]|nr:metal-sensing transcriptional repressor [Candidatus Harrisonbacteria bacterium]
MKEAVKRRAMRRLKILEGQIRGLQKMIDEDAYCVTILHQSSAVKQALSGIEDLILEHHLATHTADQMRSGSISRSVKEILDIYKLSKRK